MIKDKMHSGKEYKISDEFIMLSNMSQDINQWLHEKGDDVGKYMNFIDRVCDIQEARY